jgi:hypothetical protein
MNHGRMPLHHGIPLPPPGATPSTDEVAKQTAEVLDEETQVPIEDIALILQSTRMNVLGEQVKVSNIIARTFMIVMN